MALLCNHIRPIGYDDKDNNLEQKGLGSWNNNSNDCLLIKDINVTTNLYNNPNSIIANYNDVVNGIRVRPGFKLTAYTEPDRLGTSVIFRGGTNGLNDFLYTAINPMFGNIGDAISSVFLEYEVKNASGVYTSSSDTNFVKEVSEYCNTVEEKDNESCTCYNKEKINTYFSDIKKPYLKKALASIPECSYDLCKNNFNAYKINNDKCNIEICPNSTDKLDIFAFYNYKNQGFTYINKDPTHADCIIPTSITTVTDTTNTPTTDTTNTPTTDTTDTTDTSKTQTTTKTGIETTTTRIELNSAQSTTAPYISLINKLQNNYRLIVLIIILFIGFIFLIYFLTKNK
jgi:hypothetical protein